MKNTDYSSRLPTPFDYDLKSSTITSDQLILTPNMLLQDGSKLTHMNGSYILAVAAEQNVTLKVTVEHSEMEKAHVNSVYEGIAIRDGTV